MPLNKGRPAQNWNVEVLVELDSSCRQDVETGGCRESCNEKLCVLVQGCTKTGKTGAANPRRVIDMAAVSVSVPSVDPLCFLSVLRRKAQPHRSQMC